MCDFVHLHCHTQFSLLDGAAEIGAMMDKAVADGQKGVALTDHGNMFGAFKFVAEANKRGIKAIVGCEFYLVENRHRQKFEKSRGEKDMRYHQLLLAKNQKGYENLSKLCSLGYIEGMYSKYPRIDKELVEKYSEGLIATSCCLGAEIPQAILNKDLEKAEALQQQAVETRERIDNLTEPLLPTTSDYGFPVPNPTISSRYGFENNSYLALRANAANAAVTAIEAGVVSRVTLLSANDGYLVTVLHGNDLVVSYTNLQPPLVTVGQRVNKGHLLGYLGGGTLVPSDVLKLWVQVGNTFVDPQARLGF